MLIYTPIFITILMHQLHNEHSSPRITEAELQLSISNINQIMEKINQAVRKSQAHIKHQQDPLHTFFTQENLITENVETEDSDFVQKLKAKMNGMKIPLHQLHRKNKLSTVVEESQTLSGRTNNQNITPRGPQVQVAPASNEQKPVHSFTRQVLLLGSCETSPCELDGGKKSKVITGIRKTSTFKAGQLEVQKYPDHGGKSSKVQQKEKVKRYTKTKSMTNIKCDIFERKRQSHVQQEQSLPKPQDRSKSRGRKGLSLLSKKSLKSEQSDLALRNVQNGSNTRMKASTQISSQRKQKGSKTIKIKRRTINPFIISKQSVQLDRKNEPSKLKNCLSRTNIQNFYVSKRISKKTQ